MYQKLFEQYDMDRDGFITMDENLEQDKVMADDQGKPFDEVWRTADPRRTFCAFTLRCWRSDACPFFLAYFTTDPLVQPATLLSEVVG